MLDNPAAAPIRFAREAAPAPGQSVEIAPGVLWLRLALPYALDHVNAYLIADDGGWAVLDTGIDDARTRAAWDALLGTTLNGARVSRVIATHFHPDHVGLAAWLAGRHEAPLWMSQTEYLFTAFIRATGGFPDRGHARAFYQQGGLDGEAVELLLGRGHDYLKQTSGLPPSYHRLRAGDLTAIGGREFEVLSGAGHAPEMLMLFCRADRLFFPADQILARISPNVAVWPGEPDGDPLGEFILSLHALAATVPDDVLVLPAHNLPFHGLHARIAELLAHHAERLAMIEAACSAAPQSVAELLPVVFHRTLDPQQTGFAFGEVLAHVNRLRREGRLAAQDDGAGIRRFAPI